MPNSYFLDGNPFGERSNPNRRSDISEDVEEHLQELLCKAFRSDDNAVALCCLRLIREILCCVCAGDSVSSTETGLRATAPRYRYAYLHNLALLRARLEQHDYCHACNELGDLILWGQCLRRAEVRDVVLDLLIREVDAHV